MTAQVIPQLLRPSLIRSLKPVSGLLAVAVAYYATAEAAFLVGTLSDRIFAPFWPPNVVLFCALLLTARERWWAIVGAVFPAHVLAEMGVGMPPAPLIVAFITNCALAVSNALAVRWLLGKPPWFASFRKTAIYIAVTAGISPALVAIGGAFVPILSGGAAAAYWTYWLTWYVGNALAALTLGPFILTWLEKGARDAWLASLRRKVEAVVFVVALLAACVVSFAVSVKMSGSAFVPAILYMPLPIFLWGSVRFGARGASGAILVATVASVWLTLNGPSPFFDRDPERNVLALQLFLVGIATPMLLLTASLDQLRGAERITRALAGSLLRAQDEERRRIARDLHDSTGQNLVAVSLLASTFRDGLPASAQTRLNELEEVVQQSIRELRTMSYVLHPPSLEAGGLRSALPTYVEGFTERTGIRVALELAPGVQRLSPDVELVVYRVVQEALGNVHRHSQSATACIRLVQRRRKYQDFVVLTIEDNGRGFQVSPTQRPRETASEARGVGLESMRERIQQVGGRFSIESSPGRTVIVATIPSGRDR